MKLKIISVVTVSFIFALSSCTALYYLVHHAEKECDDCDTCALTIPEGRDRSYALCDSLINKGIDIIFTSQCLRTQLTVRPLANRIHKTISIYQRIEIESFINNLKNFNGNRDILVVGHSDQLPDIIRALSNWTVTIGHKDYDNMFVITKRRFFGTSVRLRSMTYGAPSP